MNYTIINTRPAWKKVKYSFFNYQRWYTQLYQVLNDGDVFVEIGAWTGASTLYFAESIKLGSKNIKFYTIDTFSGSNDLLEVYGALLKDDGLYKYFQNNIKPFKEFVEVIRADSQNPETAARFEDNSIAAIFIDGDHSHEGFIKDLLNWVPKVKPGGVISGHDYVWGGKGVKPVVNAMLGDEIIVKKGDVWVKRK